MSHKSTFGDSTNYAEFKDDGELYLHGTARAGRHLIFSPDKFKLPAANFPSPGLIGVFATLDFDKAIEENIYATEYVPTRWDHITNMTASISWTHDTNITGVCRWGLQYSAKKAGEALVGGEVTIYCDASAVADSNGDLIFSNFDTDILAANLEPHDDFGIRLFRDATHLNDTLNEDSRFTKLHIHFIMNKLGDMI